MEGVIRSLSNFTLTFLVIGLLASAISLSTAPKPLTKQIVVEALFAYCLLFSIGFSYLYNFVMHTFFGELAAGWPAGIKPRGPGDYQRFDFQLTKGDRSIALEVKWCKRKTCNVTNDVQKLKATDSSDRFLFVFGAASCFHRGERWSVGMRVRRIMPPDGLGCSQSRH